MSSERARSAASRPTETPPRVRSSSRAAAALTRRTLSGSPDTTRRLPSAAVSTPHPWPQPVLERDHVSPDVSGPAPAAPAAPGLRWSSQPSVAQGVEDLLDGLLVGLPHDATFAALHGPLHQLEDAVEAPAARSRARRWRADAAAPAAPDRRAAPRRRAAPARAERRGPPGPRRGSSRDCARRRARADGCGGASWAPGAPAVTVTTAGSGTATRSRKPRSRPRTTSSEPRRHRRGRRPTACVTQGTPRCPARSTPELAAGVDGRRRLPRGRGRSRPPARRPPARAPCPGP